MSSTFPDAVATDGARMWRPERPLRITIGQDLALTFATEMLVLACSFTVLRLAASTWGSEGFGMFVLAKRVIGWVQLPALMGMHLAMSRYVANALASGDPAEAGRSFRIGTTIVAVALALVIGALLLFQRPVASTVLGAWGEARTVHAIAVAAAGVVLHTLAYGALRGWRQVRTANVLQMVMLGIVPVAAFTRQGLAVESYLTLTGALMIVIASTVLLRLHVCSVLAERGAAAASGAARRWRRLARFGVSRLPGELALGALFALPVVLAAQRGGISFAGHLGIALSLVQMIGALVAPVGHTILPWISALDGQAHRTRVILGRQVFLAIGGTTVMSGVMIALAPRMLAAVFGDVMVAAAPTVRVVLCAAPAYATYVILRAVLDGLDERALNARNMLLAVGCLLAVVALDQSPRGLAVGVLVGMWLLGVRTVVDVLAVVIKRSDVPSRSSNQRFGRALKRPRRTGGAA